MMSSFLPFSTSEVNYGAINPTKHKDGKEEETVTTTGAAKNTIREFSDRLSDVMDPIVIHSKLYSEDLISSTTMEQVNDFQLTRKQKNIRLLQNVQEVLTVLSEAGFKTFLNVLEQSDDLVPIVADMRENYEMKLKGLVQHTQAGVAAIVFTESDADEDSSTSGELIKRKNRIPMIFKLKKTWACILTCSVFIILACIVSVVIGLCIHYIPQGESNPTQVKKKILKPTFSERVITVTVSFGNVYAWQWVYTAEAVDEATGISAKAQNYQSKSGAKKHALENLKAILLDRGIIRPDDI